MAEIDVCVPAEIVEDFPPCPGITVKPARRSGNWKIAADAVAGTSLTISLLQGPQTLAWLAERLHRLIRRGRGSKHTVHVDAVGPGGEMRLTIVGDADLAEITELLRTTIFGSEE